MLVVSIQANNEYTPAGDHIFEGDDINAKADEKETVNDDDKKEEPTGFTITVILNIFPLYYLEQQIVHILRYQLMSLMLLFVYLSLHIFCF